MAKIDLAPLLLFDPEWSKFFELTMEKIWTNIFNVLSSNEHYEWLVKDGAPTVSGRRNNAKNFQNIAETEEDYATAQAKLDEYFSPKKKMLTTKYFNFPKQSSSQVKLWINLSQSCKNWQWPVNLAIWQKK